MTSLGSTAAWLPVAITRTAVGSPEATPRSGRHAAPEASALFEIVAEGASSGRHAEPEWSRAAFDPQRDEDPFEWLGFTA